MKINASAFLPLTNKQRESAFTIWFPFLHVEHFLHAEHQVPHGLESQFIPPLPPAFCWNNCLSLFLPHGKCGSNFTFKIMWLSFICCVFWPANRCSTHHLLVEINFFRHNGNKINTLMFVLLFFALFYTCNDWKGRKKLY